MTDPGSSPGASMIEFGRFGTVVEYCPCKHRRRLAAYQLGSKTADISPKAALTFIWLPTASDPVAIVQPRTARCIRLSCRLLRRNRARSDQVPENEAGNGAFQP